jgi:hypothetical protein
MKVIREKIRKNYVMFNTMIFLILLLIFLLYQNWKTHQSKLQDFTKTDLLEIQGTLNKIPKYSSSRYGRHFRVFLNEFPEVSFSNEGIFLIPLNINDIINNSEIGDSVHLSIFNKEIQNNNMNGNKFTICELKIKDKVYLDLKSLNSMLKEERPNQEWAGTNFIFILLIVIFCQFLMVFKS